MDGEVVVELKSTGAMNPVFPKQLRTCLVLSGLEIGLVMNFGMALMKDGIVRVINSHNLNDSQGHLCDSAGNQFLNSRLNVVGTDVATKLLQKQIDTKN